MNRTRHWPGTVRAALAAGSLLLLGCGDVPATAVQVFPRAEPDTTPRLLGCTRADSASTTALIDTAGGSLEAATNRLAVPSGAVFVPVQVTLSAPAGVHAELGLTVDGIRDFFFARTALGTIAYGRCDVAAVPDGRPLSVWRIDPVSKTLLEELGGVDDREARSITFGVERAGNFAVGY